MLGAVFDRQPMIWAGASIVLAMWPIRVWDDRRWKRAADEADRQRFGN